MLVNALGIPIAGVIDDYDGTLRSATAPTIGSDEYVPNAPPTFSGYAFNTVQNTPATVTAAELLTRAADADGGTLQVQGVAPSGHSSQGGTVALVDQTATYTPPAGFTGLDTFTVLIGDGQGGSVTGIVTAYVTDGIPSEPNASVVTLQPSGDVALLFFGITGEVYVVERSTDLNAWTPLYNLSAAPNGMLPYLDPTPPTGKAFYRAVPFE